MEELKLADYLEEDVEDAEISQWYKKPGELFSAEEAVLEILIGKSETEICLGKAGKLEEIICEEGEIVGINDPIAKISQV